MESTGQITNLFRIFNLNIFKSNNGSDAIVNNLKGHKNFGMIELEKCERSEVAAMADLLD